MTTRQLVLWAVLVLLAAVVGGVSASKWSYPTNTIAQARSRIAACTLPNNAVFFAGGWNGNALAVVDTYNGTTGAYGTATLPGGARWWLDCECISHPTTGAGYCLFGGGFSASGTVVQTVDTFTASTRAWTFSGTALSVARGNLVAATAGTKIVFAGGNNGAGTTYYNTVDMWDVTTTTWSSTAKLSWARGSLAAVSCGGYAIFAGGKNTTSASLVVDIFDGTTWTVGALGVPRYSLAGACASNYLAVFAGGTDRTGVTSAAVDMYNTVTKVWTTSTLTSAARTLMAAVGVGTQVLFIGGESTISSQSAYGGVDIYDTSTSAWSSVNALTTSRWSAAAGSVGQKALIAGGEYYSGGSTYINSAIEVYDANTPLCNAGNCQNGATCTELLSTYTCTCAPGFSGTYCQTNINECASNPCQMGAACTDAINGYSCACPVGYLRPNCAAVGAFQTQRALQTARLYISNTCLDNKQVYALGELSSGAGTGMSETMTVSSDGTNLEAVYQYNTLSTARFVAAAANAISTSGTVKKAVFAGGLSQNSGGVGYAVADIYDYTSTVWVETAPLVQARFLLAGTGVRNLAIFAGGIFSGASYTIADIYNADTLTWSSTSNALSVGRGGLAACTVNNSIAVFAGGFPTSANAFSTVDVYYYHNNSWIASPGGFALSIARSQAACTSLGLKVFVAGGQLADQATSVTRVDIFDFATNSLTTTELSVARCLVSALTVGTKIVFGGGYIAAGSYVNAIDMYDTVAQTWSVTTLSSARFAMGACAYDTTAYFAGGGGTGASAVIDVLNLSPCMSQPCGSNGNCTGVSTVSYSCTCAAGYSGFNCQTDINECASNPCVNGATCVDGSNGFTCACALGYSGVWCQTNINECASSPCMSGQGTCVDGIGAYTCTCVSGFSGTRCQTNINECASNPCVNGGTCVDAQAAFSCTCPLGYSGTLCQTNINECASNPCTFGVCQDGVNAYACVCPTGYSGLQCQTNINECASLPCVNGATCVDGIGNFTCTCVLGYTGVQCQTNINECASNPCVAGTCIDGINNFTCSCPAGYTGKVCQTNINECASNPCTNGGTCTDGINSFTCACRAGYAGVRCETDSNECASNPCVHGTCVDGVNSFSCSCPSTFNGPTCANDVNECLTSNGGCGPYSVCTNFYGGFNCTVYVQPGSVTSLEAVQSSSPLVLGTITGQKIRLQIGSYTTPVTSLAVTLGVSLSGEWNTYACTGLTLIGAMVGPLSTVECSVTGVGAGYVVIVSQSGVPLAASAQTVSFPPPTLGYGSLMQNRTGYDSARTDALLLDTTLAVKLSFNGTQFYPLGARVVPAEMTVTYGTAASGGTSGTGAAGGACTIVVAESTDTLLTCVTTPGSQGADLIFAVTVGGQTVTSAGLFTLSFPLQPVITRVSGCGRDTGNSTSGCQTPGGDLITVYGSNFFQRNLGVSVGGANCEYPTLVSGDARFGAITCTTTASQGGLSRPVIVTSDGVSSNPAPYLNFAAPTIAQVIGCEATASPRAIVNCPTTGGSAITLLGSNFGSSDATVLIGAALCNNPQQNSSRPHWAMTCALPSGTGKPLAILLLQGGGGIGSNASMSYTACQPGTKVNGVNCDPCPEGQYSAVENAQDCKTCLSGTHTEVTSGASECVSCGAGRYSDNTASTCQDCQVGKAVAASGQGSCPLCTPGSYTNVNGSQTCTACDPGTFQSNSGQSYCQQCNPGTYSAAGVEACSKCLYGTMAPGYGLTTCVACPDNSVSRSDFTVCDCLVDYYATSTDLSMRCESCPVGADCTLPGTQFESMIASDGWWRESNTSTSFYQCLTHDDCVSGGCAAHRVGPICAVCAPGYSQNSNGAACTACPSHSASVGGTVGYIILIAAAIVIVFYIVWRSEPAKIKSKSPYQHVKAWSREDRVAPNYAYNFKILLSYLQIATTLLALQEVPWPSAFQQFLEYFSFVNLDFIPWGSVQCVTTLNFYAKLALLFTVPFAVLLFVAVVPYALLHLRDRFDYTDRAQTRHERALNIAKIMRLIVFALFLMYPAISAQVLSFFICRTINGQSYLVADFTLQCHDSEWNKYLPLAIVAIFVYPVGIPVFLGWQLWRVRRRLRMEVTILSLGLAYDAYQQRYWWWELADLITKLFLTSLLGFFPPQAQCAVGMGVVGAYLMAVLTAAPYVRHIDDRLSCTVQAHLFLILLIGYVLQTNDFKRGSAADVTASVLMFCVLIALVALVVVHIVIFTRKYVRNMQRKKAIRDQVSMRGINPLQNGGVGESVVSRPSDTTGSGDGSGDRTTGGNGAGASQLHGLGGIREADRERIEYQFNAMGMHLDGEAAPMPGASGSATSPRSGGGSNPASPTARPLVRGDKGGSTMWLMRAQAQNANPRAMTVGSGIRPKRMGSNSSVNSDDGSGDEQADVHALAPKDVELTHLGGPASRMSLASVDEHSHVAAAVAAAGPAPILGRLPGSSKKPHRESTITGSIVALANAQNAAFEAQAALASDVPPAPSDEGVVAAAAAAAAPPPPPPAAAAAPPPPPPPPVVVVVPDSVAAESYAPPPPSSALLLAGEADGEGGAPVDNFVTGGESDPPPPPSNV